MNNKFLLLLSGLLLLVCLLVRPSSTQPQCGIHCPVFTATSYVGSVPENATLYTEVMSVSATNLNGDSMIYGITYLGVGFPFDIDPTGTIHVSGQLNYQLQSRYDFTVTATMYLGFNKVVPCTINIIDILDPVLCASDPMLVHIPEDTPTGVGVSQCINCTSPEQPNEKLQYFTSHSLISVDASGMVWLNEMLNYENQTDYNITLKFADSSGNGLQGVSYIIVTVLPVNEYPPVFNQTNYQFSIVEGSEIGTLVGVVSATDEDEGVDGILEYTLSNGTDLFYISHKTGEIHSSMVFDYEQQSMYYLTVTVSDKPLNASTKLEDSVTVTIHIIDANDNKPVFGQNPYVFNVSEDSLPSTLIAAIQCTDEDSTGYNNIAYLIQSGNDTFSIDQSTGEILLQAELDYEQAEYYQLSVTCVDPNIDEFSSNAIVIIQVLDANENTPYFTKNDTISLEIASDLPIGSSICVFEATDKDGEGLSGKLSYSINYTESCPPLLTIASNTGTVFLTGQIDLDIGEALECSIIVSDSLPPIKTAEGKLYITITSGNTSPPVCDPSFTLIYMPETASIGTLVTAINCTDSNGDVLQYTVIPNKGQGGEGGLFAVNQSTAYLILVQELDYETQSTHTIEVSVSDSTQSVLYTVLLIVEPVNEHQPIFIETSLQCNVSESTSTGTAVCTVEAQDSDKGADHGIMRYYFNENKNNPFMIDYESGNIYVTEPLDYEDIPQYLLTIYTIDSSNATDCFTATAILTIAVEDSNDNSPLMDRYVHANVVENSAPGTVITELNCTDADSANNGQTDLIIVSTAVAEGHHSGNNASNSTSLHLFSINAGQYGGYLVVSNGASIDYESATLYHVDIICHDNGLPVPLSLTATVLVSIYNVNEYAPYFDEDTPHIVYLSVTDEPGTKLVTLTAVDGDYNDELCYSMSLIEPAIPALSFLELDYYTGVVKTTTDVVCEDGFQFTYDITVTDSGGLTDTTSITFIITECPGAPLVSDTNRIGTISVNENTSPGTAVYSIECYTPNHTPLPQGSKIQYKLQEGVFSVDPDNGTLYTQSPLDYETMNVYTVSGGCYYTHSPSIVSNITIYVQVVAVNEFPPVFETRVVVVNISEGVPQGSLITTVAAYDSDKGKDGEIEYAIDGDDGTFVIDRLLGSVHLLNPLDREACSEYSVLVTATDSSEHVQDRETGNMTLTVIVQDVNDNPPVCSNIVYHTAISRSAQAGTLVTGAINCSDPDDSSNGPLTYTIQDHSEGDIEGVSTLALTVDKESGYIYLAQSIAASVSSYNTISVVVSDSNGGPGSLTTTVYVSIMVTHSGLDEVVVDNETELDRQKEGWRNNVTTNIDKIGFDQWSNKTEKLFQETIAAMTTIHCALYPSSCSLLTSCPNITIDSNYNCSKYITFTAKEVVLSQHIIQEQLSNGGVYSLHINLYVLLPEGVARALFRKTNYVIPQDTMNTIVTDNSKTISAVVRDSVSNDPVQSLASVWKQLAVSLLVIVLIFASIVLFAVIITKLYKEVEKIRNKNMIYPMELANTRRRVTTPSVVTGAGTICSSVGSSTLSPPSTSAAAIRHHHRSEICSVADISEETSSTGSVGHTSSTSTHGSGRNLTSGLRRFILQRLKVPNSAQQTNQPIMSPRTPMTMNTSIM